MPTRMDRYRAENLDSEEEKVSRITKNEELYKNIYADRQYSNIEGIASISKSNEIDIDKLKEMLRRKEEREERKYRTAKIEPVQKLEDEIEKQRDYDINEAIDKAKKENHEDNRYRSLKSVDLEFLKSLDLQDLRDLKENEEVKEELTELIHTITNTKALNKLGDKELSLEMLSELKPTGNTVMDTRGDLKEAIEREKKDKEEKKIEETAFFTTNNLFKKEDFESLGEIHDSIKENNKTIKILMFVLGAFALILATYLIVNLWKG